MKISLILGSMLTAALLAGCASERHASKAELESQAKISRDDAERIALQQVPGGTVKDAEIEKEHGKLIWSFDIATSDSKDITEVAIDALNGQVAGVEKETPEQQAKEKKDDKEKD